MTRPVIVACAAAAMATATVGFAAGFTVSPVTLTGVTSAAVPTQSTCVLTATADTFTEELNPLTTHGGDTTIRVRSFLATNERTFVRFDLSGCSFAATADVVTATLEMYLGTAPAVTRTHEVHRVTASWTESTMNWASAPGVAASATATTTTGTASGVTRSWTVTTDVKNFVEGVTTNHGWRIKDATESSALARTATYHAREHATASTRPTLRIQYYP